MNAARAPPNATRKLVALILKAPTNASAKMVTMVTERTVKTSTSALKSLATLMQSAKTPKALTVVAVIQVSKVMGSHVLILMSARRVPTIVIGTPNALTLEGRIVVTV